MRTLKMHSKGPKCFSFEFWGEWGRNFFGSFFFVMCSHPSSQMHAQIPNLLPKMLLLAPHFYPICFGQSWTFMYINYRGTFVVLLRSGAKKPKGQLWAFLACCLAPRVANWSPKFHGVMHPFSSLGGQYKAIKFSIH
jgi:hypothetical protein